jgi:hypothetical protein
VLLAQSSASWDAVRELAPGSQIRVTTLDGHKLQGSLQSVTDDAIVLATSKSFQTFGRPAIAKISVKRQGHRGRNALIGLGVGAGAGLVAGEIHDHGCPASGCAFIGKNAGKEVLTPLGALIGVTIGALVPTGGWHDIYRAK